MTPIGQKSSNSIICDHYLFSLALDTLAKANISPRETLYVGNDLINDIAPAQNAGMQTALFTGDKRCTFLGSDTSQMTVPDITISHYREFETKTGL